MWKLLWETINDWIEEISCCGCSILIIVAIAFWIWLFYQLGVFTWLVNLK